MIERKSYIAGVASALLLTLGAVWLLGPWPRNSGKQGQPAPSPLSVVSFNAQFLPGPGRLLNKRPDAAYRAAALAVRLKSFDVIALNEVFDKECQSLLLSELREQVGSKVHVVTSPKDAVSPFGIGSGLLLVTRHAIVATHSVSFGNDSPPLAHGALGDGFAKKGALHARIRLGPAGPVDVFVTHLESQDAKIREAQIGLLAGFIASHCRPDVPLLLFGDLNVVGGEAEQVDPSSEYRMMVEKLKSACPHAALIDLGSSLEEGRAGTSDSDRSDGGERIDYIFLACSSSGRVRLRPRDVSIERFEDARVKTFSDHLGVTAELSVVPWLQK